MQSPHSSTELAACALAAYSVSTSKHWQNAENRSSEVSGYGTVAVQLMCTQSRFMLQSPFVQSCRSRGLSTVSFNYEHRALG